MLFIGGIYTWECTWQRNLINVGGFISNDNLSYGLNLNKHFYACTVYHVTSKGCGNIYIYIYIYIYISDIYIHEFYGHALQVWKQINHQWKKCKSSK